MRVVRRTEVRQCLNYTLHSEPSFTSPTTNSSVPPPTIAITEPEASRQHTTIICSLPQPSTTRGNYNAYLLFLETKQSSRKTLMRRPLHKWASKWECTHTRPRCHLERLTALCSIISPRILIREFIYLS